MSGESSQAKQYPRNQVYNNNYKPAFQATSKTSEQKQITNLSGTSLADLTYSPKSSTKTSAPEIAILHQRIEYLQKELEMLTRLLMEEDSRKGQTEVLQKQNRALQENLQKTGQINAMLEAQLDKSEKNNEQLVNALKSVNEELETMRAQREKDQNINESKNSKSKEEVQEDIIKLNEEISNVLMKLHALNEDYEVLRELNEKLSSEKTQMAAKITELEERLSQELNRSARYKSQCEYNMEEILLLKQEIQQVNDLSIQKQKQIQDDCSSKEKQLQLEIQQLKNENEGRRSSKKEISEDNSTLIEIKNVKIRGLQIDNEMLKKQLEAKDQQMTTTLENIRAMQREVSNKNDSIEAIHQDYRSKMRAIQRSYDNRITLLEQHIKDLKYVESKVSYLQQQNRDQLSQLREKQEKIYQLQSQIREGNNRQYMLSSLEEEVKTLRGKEQAKDIQIQAIQLKRMELSDELDDVKRKLLKVQEEVKNTNEVKEKYGTELAQLKQKMRELIKLSQQQERQIKDIETQRDNSSKKRISDISIIETTHIHRLDDLESTNKELEKMLLNQKIEKDNQNKRYKQLLQDYKQLNHELTMQLQLYRDTKNVDHPFCPLQSSRDSRDVKFYRERSSKDKGHSGLKKELEIEKSKYEGLLQKHEKTLERQKAIEAKLGHLQKEQKQSQFLKIDNSSLRAQVAQLNIRIEEYKSMIEAMRKEADNRNIDAQKLRNSIQRQYESKLEIQRMEIINEYNVLLRDRNVRIEPSQLERNSPPRQPQYPQYHHRGLEHPSPQRNTPPSFVSTDMTKIRYHPEYKKLQQEYMVVHKQLLELQQLYKRSLTECKDQIQKLKIENEYHRKTIDQLHAEGYGLYPGSRDSRETTGNGRWGQEKERELQEYRNKYEEINKNYQKLYEEYVGYRNKNSHASDAYLSGANGDRIRQLLRSPVSWQKQNDQPEVEWLKRQIDEKVIQLEMTPRQPASVIERASWMIDKLSALVQQLKQDRDTLKLQKKQVQKENDKLKVKLETLEYEKGHNLKELAIAIEKYKYLEQKHMQLSERTPVYTEHYEYRNQIGVEQNKGKGENRQDREGNEKDIHKHQAEIIRKEKLALLRKYQKEMEMLDDKT